jgi:glutamate/tyrosine decarboxylase-like PLP-dependent enzyme
VTQGTDGFEKHMDRLMELTEYMVKRIKSMPDKFYLILEPELVNVSFWYVPTRLRSMAHGQEREKLLGQVSINATLPAAADDYPPLLAVALVCTPSHQFSLDS